MTFSEITNKLLALPNCSVTVGGCLFIQDLHQYVKTDINIIQRCSDLKSDKAQLIKANLKHILINYEKARRAPVGNKRPR